MGGVSVDTGGGGGKKAVDSNINMVPMIDLLISCIAFLLMTAVWVQSGTLLASQPHGAPSPDQPQDVPQDQLKIQISETGFRVGVSAADMRDIPLDGSRLNYDELRRILTERHQANQQMTAVWIQPDPNVHYAKIVRVMDIVYEIFGSHATGGPTIQFV